MLVECVVMKRGQIRVELIDRVDDAKLEREVALRNPEVETLKHRRRYAHFGPRATLPSPLRV
jgi:hypothetical protein